MNRTVMAFLLAVVAAPSWCVISRSNAASPAAPVGSSAPLRPLPHWLTVAGPFTVKVSRASASRGEDRALATAEAADPPRDEVLEAIRVASHKLDNVPSDSHLWWSSQFDNVRIAYAITADAVRYYLRLSEAFRHKKFKEVEPFDVRSSNLSYSASVSRADTFTARGRTFHDVYVVKMSLSWSSGCGPLCGMGFGKSREVVVSLDGTVLAISGDGTPRRLFLS